ncbi:MAG: LptF/LptG family permease, partial [Saprospiraceae bacterium]|nr:LptF/LptG family permease [Saprospiraceae bacterium]
MVKIIDRLVIKSFIPPFIVTFAIAVFFFLMQTLWFYIDDIAGKGLGIFLVMELLAYKCVSLVPMALPLAILISSVM